MPKGPCLVRLGSHCGIQAIAWCCCLIGRHHAYSILGFYLYYESVAWARVSSGYEVVQNNSVYIEHEDEFDEHDVAKLKWSSQHDGKRSGETVNVTVFAKVYWTPLVKPGSFYRKKMK